MKKLAYHEDQANYTHVTPYLYWNDKGNLVDIHGNIHNKPLVIKHPTDYAAQLQSML